VPEESRAGSSAGFVGAGLKLLELEADETELAVIEAVDALYGPPLQALVEAELDGVEPEPEVDPSHAPRSPERR
jgi:hypothetical protein